MKINSDGITMLIATKPFLTLADADEIARAARGAALAEGAAVTICIVDDAGQLLRLDRFDAAPRISLRVAEGKARTAAEMRMSTEAVEQYAGHLPSLIAIPDIFPFRGGVPLFDGEWLLGAVGVSGGSPEQDARIAEAAARSLPARD